MRRPNITAIRERADSATEGPWNAAGDTVKTGDLFNDCLLAPGECGQEMKANAAFIGASRADVPALCDYVEHVESLLTRALALAGQVVSVRAQLAPPAMADAITAVESYLQAHRQIACIAPEPGDAAVAQALENALLALRALASVGGEEVANV